MDKPVFNHTAHKELWNWLAKHPTKNKRAWPGWKNNGGEYDKPINLCFACDSADKDKTYGCPVCDSCPLVWPFGCCQNLPRSWPGLLPFPISRRELYAKWNGTSINSHRTRTKLALQIANLPVREGVKCI